PLIRDTTMPTAAVSTMRASMASTRSKRGRAGVAVLNGVTDMARVCVTPVNNGLKRLYALFLKPEDEVPLRRQPVPLARNLAVKDQRIGPAIARALGQPDAGAIVAFVEIAIDEARLGVAQFGPAEDRAQVRIFVGSA